MLHILSRGNTWYFNRRVPNPYRDYDSRDYVRISLKTSSRKEAIRLSALENIRLQEYWEGLVSTGRKHSHDTYARAVELSTRLGFPYVPKEDLALGNLEELVKRLLYVVEQKFNEKQAEAVLGMIEQPCLLLSALLPKFWELTAEIKLEKSERQYKKWQNPRLLAMENFIKVVGDKPVQDLIRQDMLDFKQWFIDRVKAEEVTTGTANKHFIYVKHVIETVCDNQNIGICDKMFKKLLFKKEIRSRLPFTTNHIIDVLLNDSKMAGLPDHLRKMIGVFADTGINIDEQIGIRPENIFLGEKIPYVVIMSHEKDKLKTVHRERTIPLVGFALDAFKAYPDGFASMVDDPDKTNTLIGKYLRKNKLLPTNRHSLYSLRHSFQDRLTNLDCPDRIQTDLMGHAFTGRTKYGAGASLDHSYKWMKKIQLKR